MTTDDQLISQRTAQRLLAEPEFCAALEAVKTAYLTGWQRTKPDETARRETAYFAFKAICDLEAVLKTKALSARARDVKDLVDGRDGTSPST